MSSSDRQPVVGEAFNPWRRFNVACVPEPLLRSSLVSSGAKLCWAQLARHAGENGRCYPRQATLAAELAISERQVRRYVRQLERAQLLRSIRTGLNDPNSYQFLWHTIFEVDNPLNLQDRTSMSDHDRTHVAALDRTSASLPLKEEESPSKESGEENTRSIECERPARSRHAHRPAALREWPAADVDAVRRALGSFRYQDGSAVQPTDELVARLLDTGKFYLRTAFEVAALLHRKETELQKRPRWWPQTPEWFVRVIDRAYADDWLASRMPPAHAKAATAQAEAYPEDPGTQAEFATLIQQVASAKGFPRR